MRSEALTDTLRQTLAQIDPSGAPRTTSEVAEDLDLGRRSTYNRLERLVEHDRLETKKVGANGRVWWRPATTPSTPEWPAAAESLVDDVLDDVEVGIFVLDEDVSIAWINQATERYFGLDSEDVVGRDKRRLVDEHLRSVVDDAEQFAETVLATYDDNTSTEQFECRVTAGDGRAERWLEHRSRPIDSGAYAGGRVELYYDVTERKRSERERREREREFTSLVETVEEYAIYTLDPEGYVRTWNPGAERINGYEAEEIVGEHFSRFYTESERAAGVPEENLALAAREGWFEDEGWRVRPDGSQFWASFTITAMRDDDGEIEGYAKVTRDMTEQRERERQLREEKVFAESMLDSQRDLVYAFDADGAFLRWNDRVNEVSGYTDAEIQEMEPAGFIADRAQEDLEAAIERVLEDGEALTVELPLETKAGEEIPYRFTAGPLTDEGAVRGITGTGRDVSDEKARQRRLERQHDELKSELADVFERVDDAFYAVDAEMRFEYVNDRAAELIGSSETELLGRTVWEALSVAEDDPIRERFQRALDSQESATFERFSEPLGIWETVRVYPSESGLSVYFTDITGHKERERELEESRNQYETLIENFPNGAVTLVDEDLRYLTAGGRSPADADVTIDDLIGAKVDEVLPAAFAEFLVPRFEAALGGDASTFERTVAGSTYTFHVLPVRDDDGDIFAAMGMSQDVTERRRYEDRLRALYESSRELLEADDTSTISELLVETGESVLDLPGLVVYRYEAERDRLVPETHSVDAEFMRVEFPTIAPDDSSITGRVFSSGESQYYEDILDSPHMQVSPDATDMRSGHFVPLGEEGILVAGSTDVDGIDESTRQLVEVLATNATAAYERVAHEREIVQQNDQLAALDSLHEVAREITSAVIDQSTREEIERTVCEHFAASESYLFAWIGETDPTTQEVRLRTEAGVEGYLDGVAITVDPDDERSKGPTGRALRTGETQVTNDIRADSRHDPWRTYIEQYGFRSSAAIPIVHEDTVYGVLNVYAERPNAFQDDERDVVGQLGEVVGHAIAAAERKQALLSDELVELDFQVTDVFTAIDAPVDTCGTVTLDDIVPAKDGAFLVYGTASPDALDTVHGLVEVLPHWESVTIVAENDPVRFELRLVDPPVLSAVTSRGGYVDEAIIENGDYRMTIHLAPTVDVREITDAVEAAYPSAELLRRQQIRRSHDASHRLQRRLATDLTDRQRSALETAYHAGFFEWPRETTGEEIADSLGIAPSTFHHHLRKAQQTALDALFSASLPSSTT